MQPLLRILPIAALGLWADVGLAQEEIDRCAQGDIIGRLEADPDRQGDTLVRFIQPDGASKEPVAVWRPQGSSREVAARADSFLLHAPQAPLAGVVSTLNSAIETILTPPEDQVVKGELEIDLLPVEGVWRVAWKERSGDGAPWNQLTGNAGFELPAMTFRLIDILNSAPSFSLVTAEPNYILAAARVPSEEIWVKADSFPTHVWALKGIDAPSAWDQETGSSAVVLAVIDSGVKIEHPDLNSNVYTNPDEIPDDDDDDDGNGYPDDLHGWDFSASTPENLGDADANDDLGHGTSVAGVAGAAANNESLTVGVSWELSILPVRILDEDGCSSVDRAVLGLDYAEKSGAGIATASWGGRGQALALRKKLESSSDRLLVVAAAGNEVENRDDFPFFPASYALPNVISVTGIDDSGIVAFASGEECVHLAAPGDKIFTTENGEFLESGFNRGTSVAVPFVAGAAALLKSRFGDLTPSEIRDRILGAVRKSSTDPLPVCSGGTLNLREIFQPDIDALRSQVEESCRNRPVDCEIEEHP